MAFDVKKHNEKRLAELHPDTPTTHVCHCGQTYDANLNERELLSDDLFDGIESNPGECDRCAAGYAAFEARMDAASEAGTEMINDLRAEQE